MSKKAEQFLAVGKQVSIFINRDGNLEEKIYTVRHQTIRHNLQFARFVVGLMKEGSQLSDMEWTQENIVEIIMELAESKLEELASLLVPEVKRDDVLDSYFECWADVLEAYIDINFRKVLQSFKKALAVAGTMDGR